MHTIALITYDISPYRGSEASVSWNYVWNMRHTNKLIVVYGRGKEEIERFISENGAVDNVEFINNPIEKVTGGGDCDGCQIQLGLSQVAPENIRYGKRNGS